jgi:hypothetical protein
MTVLHLKIFSKLFFHTPHKHMMTAYVNAKDREEPLFTLGQEGHLLPSPLQDYGSDMDDDGTFVDQHAQDLDQRHIASSLMA